MTTFAERLREAREQSGLTQEQLAQKVGVTRQAVSRWEQGITQPDMEMLVALGNALQMNTEFLAFGKPTERYQRFQKKNLVCFISALACACVVFLVMTFLGPYVKDWVNRHYKGNFVYFWVFQLLLPPTGCFSLGLSLSAFIALFYNTGLSKRWRITVLILSLIAIAPSLLVIVDDALGTWIPGHSEHIVFALYLKTLLLPGVHTLLFRLLPGVAGALCFLGFNKD